MVRRVLKRVATAAFALIGLEAAYAVLKPAPILEQFDPSGVFGDPDHPALRVAVLGDSSVTAPGVAGPHEIWVHHVCLRLAETRHVVLKSFAVGGSRAQDVIEGQLEAALEFRPDLVFVSVGANDAIKGVSLRRFAEDLDHLIAELVASGATVVQSGVGMLGTIPRLYPPLSTLMSKWGRRFDQIHREIAAAYDTAVVDQWSDDPVHWKDPSMWAADYFHVSAAGHARWAETTWRTVGPLMGHDEPV